MNLAIGLFLLVAANTPATAQQISLVPDVERVRALYVAAAYADALAAIPPLGEEPARTDVEQYRALCLLALGREKEAIASVERVVRDHPTFVPPAGDTTPRLLAIFAGARSKLVPDAARRAYADAKAEYERKDKVGAHAAFQRTLDILESLPEEEKSGLADLRLLASEFLELSASGLPSRLADGSASGRPSTLTNDPAGAPASVPRSPSSGPSPVGAYAPPIAIKEALPAWNPPDNAARRTEYAGMLRVHISADGRVTAATIVKMTHPAYDNAAMQAAKAWTYRPATRGGQPVAAQKDIQIRLVPQ